jgi:hypothetical protein
MIRWAGHVARVGKGKAAYRVLVGNPDRSISIGISRHGVNYNIKMDLQESDRRSWFRRTRGGLFLSTVMNFRII